MMENLSVLRKIKGVKPYTKQINKYEEKIFMEIVTSKHQLEMEGFVDLKAELMSALEELKKKQNEGKFFGRKVVKIPRREKIKR